MMLNILKCRKEGMSEKKNVRMPPQTSAQYLEAFSILSASMYAHDSYWMHVPAWCQFSEVLTVTALQSTGQAGRLAYNLLTPVTM